MNIKKLRFLPLIFAFSIMFYGCGEKDSPITEQEEVEKEEEQEEEEDLPEVEVDPNAVEIINSDFNTSFTVSTSSGNWKRVNYYNSTNATVEWVNNEGINFSGCIKMTISSSNGKGSVGVAQSLTGLEPFAMYRFKANVKTENVADGRGAVIFDHSSYQYWNASKFIYGSNNWQEVYMDFYSDKNGQATISCALGYRYGGTTNGGYATGTVYYDNISVTKMTTDNVAIASGKYVTLCAEKKDVTQESITARVEGLDKIYEALVDLIGVKPHGDGKLVAMGTEGLESGYWALAGNPILLKSTSIAGVINSTTDISFGLVHEIGHVFNAGGHFVDQGFTTKWNWNDELFANFRAYYAIAATNSPCSFNGYTFQGEELKNFYKSSYPTGTKTCYDNTFGVGVATSSGDPITYLFIRLGDTLGWDAIKGMLRDAYKNGTGPFNNNWEKFDYLMTTLQKYTDQDVRATFPDGELELIKEGLGGN